MRQWISGTDRLLAGRRFVAAFGELNVPEPEALQAALSIVVEAGAHTRLRLTPDNKRRTWRTDAALPPVWQLPRELTDVARVLEHVRAKSSARAPLELHVSDRTLVLDIDHGLGDGRFALQLTAALLAACRGELHPWLGEDDSPLLLPRAVWRTFAAHPHVLAAAGLYAANMRYGRAAESAAEHIDWAPSFAVVVASINAEAVAAVENWRHRFVTPPSAAATWLQLVRRALYAAGLRMTDQVGFAFDCRRYLPPRTSVNGNFAIGLEVSSALNDPPSVVSARLQDLIRTGVPLAGMAAVSGRGLLPPKRGPSLKCRRPSTSFAEVMYTDMGTIATLEDAPWREGRPRSAAGLLDPAGSNSVTVLNTRVGRTRTVSLSFHDNVVDRGLVERAADFLINPLALLADAHH